MNFRLPTCLSLVIVALCVVGPAASRAADRPRGRRIEFSDPKSTDVITNLHQLNRSKDDLRQLEEDFERPLRNFLPASSLDGVPAAPPPTRSAEPMLPSKRARELLERQKYWMFMTPEDLLRSPADGDILKDQIYGLDGRPMKSLTPLDRFYQRLLDQDRRPGGQSSAAKNDPIGNLFKASEGRDGARPEEELPADLGKAEQELEKLLRGDSENAPSFPPSKRSPFSDVFGLDQGNAPAKTAAEKARMEEIKELYGVSTPLFGSAPSPADTTFANPLTDLITSSTRPEIKPVTPVPGVPPAGSVPIPGALGDPFKPAYIAGAGLPSAPGQAVTAPPPTVPPPTLTPPRPKFEFPRRKF